MVEAKEKEIKEYIRKYDNNKKFVPLTYDKFFKMVMKANTDIFKEFLVRVLELEEYMKDNYIIFMDKELTCEQIKEHGKVVDINIEFGPSLIIEVEINREIFSAVKDRNGLYLEKLDISKYKEGENYQSIKKKKIYQLNLNCNSRENKNKGKSIIVEYDIVHKEIYDNRKKKFNINLVHYYNKWYNKEKMTYEEYVLASLYSNSYEEIYDILSNIIDKDRLNKLMEGVINMLEDGLLLHEWEKEKLDRMVQENLEEYAREEGLKEGAESTKLELIKNLLNQNIDYETISKVSGKTIKEIEEIQLSMKEE